MKDLALFYGERSRRIVTLAKLVFASLALLAIAYAGWTSRDAIRETYSQAEPHLLLTSIAIWIGLHGIAPAFTRLGLSTFGHTTSYKEAFFIHNLRLPAKYLPGGIWHTVSKSIDYKNRGATSTQIALYLFLENAMLVVMAITVGCLMLLSIDVIRGQLYTVIFISLVFSALAIISLPLVFHLKIRKAATRFQFGSYWPFCILVAAHWSVAALAFSTYFNAYPESDHMASSLQSAGAYLISWAIGYVSIFAPQGIGVSEAVSALLLKDLGNTGSLIVVIATFRIIVLIGDIGAWAIAIVARNFIARQHIF